jgi:hypothetical protein
MACARGDLANVVLLWGMAQGRAASPMVVDQEVSTDDDSWNDCWDARERRLGVARCVRTVQARVPWSSTKR